MFGSHTANALGVARLPVVEGALRYDELPTAGLNTMRPFSAIYETLLTVFYQLQGSPQNDIRLALWSVCCHKVGCMVSMPPSASNISVVPYYHGHSLIYSFRHVLPVTFLLCGRCMFNVVPKCAHSMSQDCNGYCLGCTLKTKAASSKA